MPTKDELRQQILDRRIVAQQQIAAARRDALFRKQEKSNPPPTYIEMADPTGNAETDTRAELASVDEGFRKRKADEKHRFEIVTDTEYHVTFSFLTREQKEVFLAKLNLLEHGDKYVDGVRFATGLGIDLPSVDVGYFADSKKKPDPTWVGFVKHEETD